MAAPKIQASSGDGRHLFGSGAVECLTPYILSFCAAPDVVQFGATCQAANAFSHSPFVWKNLLEIEFDICKNEEMSRQITAVESDPGALADVVISNFEKAFRHLFCSKAVFFHFCEPAEVKDLERTFNLHTPGGITGHRKRVDFVEIEEDMAPLNTMYFPLKKYNVAFVCSDASNTDMSWATQRDALGTWLARFHSGGGTVVQLMFTLCSGIHLTLGGLWEMGKTDLITPDEQHIAPNLQLGALPHGREHPLLSNIANVDGGDQTYYSVGTLRNKAMVLAKWSNGVPFIVVDQADFLWHNKLKTSQSGFLIALNIYPVSSDCDQYPYLWTRKLDNHATASARKQASDGAGSYDNDVGRLLVNCLMCGSIRSLLCEDDLAESNRRLMAPLTW